MNKGKNTYYKSNRKNNTNNNSRQGYYNNNNNQLNLNLASNSEKSTLTNNNENKTKENETSCNSNKSNENKDLTCVSNAKEEFLVASKPREKCSLGSPIELITNHYGVKIDKEFTVYQYDLSFYKQNETKEMNITKEIAKEFFNKIYDQNPSLKCKMFYDLKKNLYSLFEINFREMNFETKIRESTTNLRVQLKKTNQIVFKKESTIDANQLNILQLAFTFYFKMNFVSLNPQRFFKSDCEKKQLGFDKCNLDSWKGFFVSLRPSENGLTLNLNLFHSAFTKQTNLIDLACSYFRCRTNELKKNFFNFYKAKGFIQLIKYFQIIPIHLKYKSKKRAKDLGISAKDYVIKDLNINLVEFYKTNYQTVIKYPDLPCVYFGIHRESKNEILIPLELCETVAENRTNLDNKTKSDLIKQTAIDSKQRFNSLDTLRNSLPFETYSILNEINASVENDMIKLNGQVLESVEIEYAKSKKIKVVNGRWDNLNQVFYDTKSISNWVAYSFCDNEFNNDLFGKLIKKLTSQVQKHGINIPNPVKFEIINPNQDAYKFFEEEIKILKDQNLSPDFILAILPENSPIYSVLKTIGDLVYGIPTQVIKLCTAEKKFNETTASNLSLKINAKLGGTNFIISPDKLLYEKYLKNIFKDRVMIFGIDVNKPSPEDKKNRINSNSDVVNSMAAVTGSIDKTWSYYAARMLAQKKHKKDSIEYINDLKYPIKELLEEYQKNNDDKKFPERLILFRDGISEGEFDKILNHEMNEIRAACSDILNGYKPKVTYIVVQKRHQTRFCVKDGKSTNIPPGTLVDVKVVTPNMFDYFLSSHLGIQGTTKPCHYYILHDENEFSVNAIILLSHYLCHVYERSSMAVSYSAPTYYADHCADRARKYLEDKIPKIYFPKSSQLVDSYPINVHENFKNKMFYI